MNFIYHITTKTLWDSQKTGGEYVPATYQNDGFIHCSTVTQVRPVALKFYREQSSLIILEIDADSLGSAVVFENLEGGSELFPHIYRSLPVTSVHQVFSLPLNSDLSFRFPPLFA